MSEVQNGLRAVPNPAADDETIAQLIRLAGHRPPVPDADTATVKAAAHAQWQWTVAGERRRARLYRGGGALLAAAAAVSIFVGSGLWQRVLRGFADPVAVMLEADGSEGDRFKAGDLLETDAATGAVQMLAANESVRLDAGSRIRFRTPSVLELEQGAVYVDSTQPGSSLEVHTDLGLVRHLGTQFEVRLESEGGESIMRVRVREGSVEVEDRGGNRPTLLAKGEGLAVTVEDMVAESVPCYGPQWEWVTAARPPKVIKGLSVLEVLQWGTREGCWKLEFADESDRDRVAGVVVGSSMLPDGKLEDALDSVLLGSSLGLRLNPEPLADGIFLVERR